MSTPVPFSQPPSLSQRPHGQAKGEADWSVEAHALPVAALITPPPSLPALHAETLYLQTRKDALCSVLSAPQSSQAHAAADIAALDVRLRSLILSMAHYSRVSPSAPEQQAVHAIQASSEAHKSEALPPCHINPPKLPPPEPVQYPPLRQLSATTNAAPLRPAPSTLLPPATAAAASASRAPLVASFRSVRGYEEEVKDGREDARMKDEEKDGVEEIPPPTNKRKRAQWWLNEEEDGGRTYGRDGGGRYGGRGGRDKRGRGDEWQSYEAEEKSAYKAGDAPSAQPFSTATTVLIQDAMKRGQLGAGGQQAAGGSSGARPSGLASSKHKFAPPRSINAAGELAKSVPPIVRAALAGGPAGADAYNEPDPVKAEKLQAFDPKLVEQVMREALDSSTVHWSDIAGLVHAKQAVTEAVVWPMKQPELFKGPRAPPKGMLLFGPPGTGKTMIGKAIAKEAGAKFFAISASSLLSKWHGESEKLVRTLFGVARIYQPSVIFVDEIDSLLSQRGDNDAEASRRIKTELLVQMDGAGNGTAESGRLLVLGATNRPQDLDEAARRRMEKRLYIPLPNRAARTELITHQLGELDSINRNKHTLTAADVDRIAQQTHGYSGHDLANLCREASMVPMRTIYARVAGQLGAGGGLPQIDAAEVPAIEVEHFATMLERVRSSVDSVVLQAYHDWNKKFGSFPSVVVDEE